MTTIGVLGPGGVGGLIAAKFIAAGHDVTVIATERTAAEITANGLTFTQADGTSTVYRPLARPALTEPVDVLFVATKATGLLPALQRVPAAVLGDATVLPLLNGVDHLPLLRAIYPDCDVVAATIAVEAIRHRPGVIEQRSPFAALVVTDGTRAGADAAELLRSAGLDVSTHAEER
ncbi:MAG: hypothetical protein J2O49_01520, partial [Sciscionella sp.]|nr:hypothetical protein [Sciscionella sp.]